MEKIRIGHLTQFYFPIIGGQQLYIKEMLTQLSEGFEHHIYQGWPTRIPSELYYITIAPNFGERLEGKFSKFNAYFSWYRFTAALILLQKKLERENILISHYSFYLPAIKWHRKKILLSHGVLWNRPCLNNTDQYFRKNSIEALKESIVVANDTDFLREIGVNAEAGQNPFTEIRKGVWFLPNCIDTVKFNSGEVENNRSQKNIILIPRNLRFERGVHLAIEAFGLLAKDYPQLIIQIVGASYPSSQYFKYCKDLIEKYNIQDRVIFSGSQSHELMKAYYHSACMTIIPTIKFEGTSLSALESMACGTPVLSTTVGGLSDLPTLKCETNPVDLASKIKFLLANLSEIRIEQQKMVTEIFNLENWISTWKKILNIQ